MLSVSAYVVTSVRTFKCSTNRSFFTVCERDAHVNTAAQAPSGREKPNECSRLKHVRPFSIIPRLRRQGLLTGSARKPDTATQLFSVTPFANLRCVFFSMCASPTARSHLLIVRVRVLAFSSVQLALLRSTDRQRKSFEKERYEKKKSWSFQGLGDFFQSS